MNKAASLISCYWRYYIKEAEICTSSLSHAGYHIYHNTTFFLRRNIIYFPLGDDVRFWRWRDFMFISFFLFVLVTYLFYELTERGWSIKKMFYNGQSQRNIYFELGRNRDGLEQIVEGTLGSEPNR